ncbi:MAG TPA: hypothetical protein VMV90_07160 [Rectinemataceae bacterium]|nr:hypothetical protein [Rectinemataceae bacterium]
MTHIERGELDYAPYYCEENVWRLLGRESLKSLRAWALLISNAERRVVFMRQRSGRPVDGLVQWDYHVVALVEGGLEGYLVLDLDSDLQFPCPLGAYLEASFPVDVQSAQAPRFRAMSARDYVVNLVSDRSHMRRPDGSYLAPPPPWAHPGAPRAAKNNLLEWADMGLKKPGNLLSLEALRSIALSARVPDRRLPL